jgi:hypothetical protein
MSVYKISASDKVEKTFKRDEELKRFIHLIAPHLWKSPLPSNVAKPSTSKKSKQGKISFKEKQNSSLSQRKHFDNLTSATESHESRTQLFKSPFPKTGPLKSASKANGPQMINLQFQKSVQPKDDSQSYDESSNSQTKVSEAHV